MQTLRIALVFLIFTAGAIGQTGSVDGKWQAPPEAAAKQNPLAVKPELAAGGQKLYNRNCMVCHGTGTGPTTKNAPMLAADAVQQESDGALFWKISNGNSRTGMPSFSSLPDMQRWQLVLYVRSLAGRNSQAK